MFDKNAITEEIGQLRGQVERIDRNRNWTREVLVQRTRLLHRIITAEQKLAKADS